MGISSINIRNFTVFNDIEIFFSKGINIVIGENGIGKTHLIKILYSLLNIEDDNVVETVSKYFQSDNHNDGYFDNITEKGKDIVLKIYSDDYEIIGESSYANLLVVCHCYRLSDTVIRIISARKATKNEQLNYYNY